ncbi:hypothetical protein ACNQFN_11135 [Thauera butanivorans]|uniref:hypothetical protein n=1 Tax=Thauera butanivorans TaxID=86174 RepID=UPI003AB71D9A
MTIFDYVEYLGLYYGEAPLQPLLTELELTKAPKLARGDSTTYLSAKKKGVELCFDEERSVKITGKQFPEGALVLSNIRFYGKDNPGYGVYSGCIFLGITMDSTRLDVLHVLGAPDSRKFYSDKEELPLGENEWKMRWDRTDHCIFFTFNEDGSISNMSIQLPLDQA